MNYICLSILCIYKISFLETYYSIRAFKVLLSIKQILVLVGRSVSYLHLGVLDCMIATGYSYSIGLVRHIIYKLDCKNHYLFVFGTLFAQVFFQYKIKIQYLFVINPESFMYFSFCTMLTLRVCASSENSLLLFRGVALYREGTPVSAVLHRDRGSW